MNSQQLKQLKIKTSMLKRLQKEHDSYKKQTKTIAEKISQLQHNDANQEKQMDIKKHQQFLAQSESVLSNVKQKLIEAFQGLANFLSEKGQLEGIKETDEIKQAEILIMDVQSYLDNVD